MTNFHRDRETAGGIFTLVNNLITKALIKCNYRSAVEKLVLHLLIGNVKVGCRSAAEHIDSTSELLYRRSLAEINFESN